jgi:hypothetical protein
LKIVYTIIFLLLYTYQISAAEVCSRIATINYQDVLVDVNSSQKGEGLRFFLAKDKKAIQFLNKYQQGTKIKWQSTLLGSIGTILFLTGLFKNSSNSNKTTYMGVGAGLISLNIIISKTLEKNNEINLIRAIEEYNKRNIPRIYFGTPYQNSYNYRTPQFLITFTRNF